MKRAEYRPSGYLAVVVEAWRAGALYPTSTLLSAVSTRAALEEAMRAARFYATNGVGYERIVARVEAVCGCGLGTCRSRCQRPMVLVPEFEPVIVAGGAA